MDEQLIQQISTVISEYRELQELEKRAIEQRKEKSAKLLSLMAGSGVEKFVCPYGNATIINKLTPSFKKEVAKTFLVEQSVDPSLVEQAFEVATTFNSSTYVMVK